MECFLGDRADDARCICHGCPACGASWEGFGRDPVQTIVCGRKLANEVDEPVWRGRGLCSKCGAGQPEAAGLEVPDREGFRDRRTDQHGAQEVLYREAYPDHEILRINRTKGLLEILEVKGDVPRAKAAPLRHAYGVS